LPKSGGAYQEIQHMHWTKIREKFGAIVAILFVIVFGAIVAAAFGFPIPIVSDILRQIGIG